MLIVWSFVLDHGAAVGGLGTFVVAAYGTVRALPYFRSQSTLVRRLEAVTTERDQYQAAAKAYQASSEGWESAVDQLTAEIKELSDRVRELSECNAALTRKINEQTDKINELQSQLGTAVIYIYAMIDAEHNGTPRPPVPANLRPALEAQVKQAQALLDETGESH